MIKIFFFTVICLLLFSTINFSQNTQSIVLNLTEIDRWKPIDSTKKNTERVERQQTIVVMLELLDLTLKAKADELLNYYKKNPSNFASVEIYTGPNKKFKEIVPITAFVVSCLRSSPCNQTNFVFNNRVKVFLELGKTLPEESFEIRIILGKRNSLSEFQIDKLDKSQSISSSYKRVKPEDNESPPAPEKKNLDRNLDLGLTFTSSVEDKEIPATTTTPATTVRQRTNRGVIDLAFAPWLEVLKPTIRRNKAIWFLTPAYIKANAATGKIEKDTLSLNRVLIGSEAEMRYYRSRDGAFDTPTVAWFRLKLGVIHASDRDFKQKEIYANAEFKPVWAKLFKPYDLNYTIETINGEDIKHQKWWGLKVEPLVGFAFGRTYSRRNPAAAIKVKDTFTRLSLGGSASLSIKDRFILTAENKFFIRSETSFDHYANYSKLTGEFRLGANRYASNSLFVSFEKGTDAPFTSYVNAVRVGYRLWGNWCQPFCK